MKTRICLLLPEPGILKTEKEDALLLKAHRTILENPDCRFCVIGPIPMVKILAKNLPDEAAFAGTEFIGIESGGLFFYLLAKLRRHLKKLAGEYESRVLEALGGRKFEVLCYASPVSEKLKNKRHFERFIRL
ncbi:MAG: hypothetical protein K6B46_01840 [Opitutales bacterium]|nr:hypothetical protein [Opitutales bacterium]